MVNQITQLFLGFAVLVIVVAISGLIGSNTLTQVSAQAGNTSMPFQMVNTTIASMRDMTTWLPIVVVVLIGSYLVALVMGAFRGYQ